MRLKYLGVMIDENPNFIAYIDYIYARIVKYKNLFSALYGKTLGLNFKSRIILYNTIFETIIDYCSLAYITHLSRNQLYRIYQLQRSMLMGAISAYLTVSYQVVNVIAGIMPIDIKVEERREIEKERAQNLEEFLALELFSLFRRGHAWHLENIPALFSILCFSLYVGFAT